MKTNTIIYWATTGLVSLGMLASGYFYFTSPQIVEAFKHLGFPDYFRVELGAAKLLGALLLIVPQVPNRVKEWTYAGFGITFLSATYAHFSSGDPINVAVAPFVFFLLLVASYVFWLKRG